jgi:uncharacterized protein (TIGR02246 family)
VSDLLESTKKWRKVTWRIYLLSRGSLHAFHASTVTVDMDACLTQKQTIMNSRLVVLTVGFIMSALLINAQTKNTMKTTFSSEQNEVMDVILKMTDAFHKKDLKGVLESYEPNAVIVFEPEKPSSGLDAISDGFKGFFTLDPTFKYSGHEVFINGDLAMHFAPWTMTGRMPDGSAVKQSGLSVVVLRKQPNGKWLMVFDNPFGQHLLQQR